MFVPTRASDYVMECLQDNSCVTLTAPSGAGKSFIARHTALILQKTGYQIIPVIQPVTEKLGLTSVEKSIIANTYIGKSIKDIDDLSHNCDFFPLLCSLYNTQKDVDVKEYFKRPFHVYKSELDRLCEHGDEGNYKICSLVICVLFNNQLEERWFEGKVTDAQRHIIEDTCNACKINRSTSKAKLKKELETLDGTFICKQNGIYKTVHDKLFDFLVHYFGELIIECLIDHCDSLLVLERFIWHTSINDETSNIDFIIKIPDDCLALYIQRLIKDWSVGKVTIVFNNTNLQVSSFRQNLLEKLKQLNKSKQVSLVNTKDTMIPKTRSGSGDTPLILTCYYGYTDMVHWILRNDVVVDKYRDNGTTGLLMASQNGHTDIVKLLLEKNPDVNLCNNDGLSPLLQASQNGHTDIVKLLLERNPDINLCDKDGSSPLLQARAKGHTDIAKLLLERNPDVHLCDKDGLSPLLQASHNGHTDIVKLLLERNSDVNLCDKDGLRPLLQASQNGHTDIVKLLLEKNPDVNLGDKDGLSPLLQASQNGHTDIVKFLLERNPDVNLCNNNGSSPLLQASSNGHTDIAKLLLERNPDVNLCDKDGSSPLLQAIQNGHTDIVKLLLERNPGVNLCDKYGLSPLLLASQNGHTDLVKLLLERNSDVHLCTTDGCIPLLNASQNGHTNIVKLLLERNSDVDLCDINGYSPLILASQNGHTDIVRLLLAWDPDPCDDTPLSTSYVNNNTTITNSPSFVQHSLKIKPDINAQTFDGCNALYFSAWNGNLKITKLLLENNADCNICTYSKQFQIDTYKHHPTLTLEHETKSCCDYLMEKVSSHIA
ncbi:ankyrin repeat-rich membrane spanning protein [Mytilus galloprovincialis]|uniref:Ankyrin repeat-rich membrane spanning protein n=1 Tax=Mytilus galloprovincialis TaxID=29158 RepID=A0A8B6FK88_MYTGA|nr:ankyrin repeat-rich membrane spanning protein [Mytilus galloprovincialis]